jgi:uncharacterized iron-regulated membrane protein
MKDGFKGGWRQSMSWLHTWVGLVSALLLYFMFVTGSVGYFNTEVDRWMRQETQAGAGGVLPVQMVQRGLARLHAVSAGGAKEWYVSLPEGRRRLDLQIYWQALPGPDGREAEYKEENLDPATGQPRVEPRKTGGGNALYRMHWALHYMPEKVAMYLVGVATMFMFIALVSGIVVHKKIFKDFFTFRPAKGQRSWLDAHNVSSVMALPFFLVITYSGLVFYTYEYLPSVKLAVYGSGEQAERAFSREVYGEVYAEVARSGTPAPMAPIGPMLAQAEARWGAGSVSGLSIQQPGDAHARLLIYQRDPAGSVSRLSETLAFDAVSGRMLDLPAVAPSGPGIFSGVMLALHEGHFAGPLLRWLYFASGLLGAAMIATGMVLWTTKRRQRLKAGEPAHAGLRFVERMNVGSIMGLPIGIAVYFWANRLIPAELPGREDWEMHALFIAWALALVHAGLRPVQRAWVEQLATGAALYALLPLVNAATADVHLARTLPGLGTHGDWVLAGFDLTLLAFGVAFAFASAWAVRTSRRGAAGPKAPDNPANPQASPAQPAMHMPSTAESTIAWPANKPDSSWPTP